MFIVSRAVIILSPNRAAGYANNTQLEPSDIGEGVYALSCYTEVTQCCRDQDNIIGDALGDWIGPDGNSLSKTNDDGFYVTRKLSSITLNHRSNTGGTVSEGLYCCRIPRPEGMIQTFCVNVLSGKFS